MNWLWVGIGGALGSVARYGAYRMWPLAPGGWPLPTFAVNLLACSPSDSYICMLRPAAAALTMRGFLDDRRAGPLPIPLRWKPAAVADRAAYLAATVVGCLLGAIAGLKIDIALSGLRMLVNNAPIAASRQFRVGFSLDVAAYTQLEEQRKVAQVNLIKGAERNANARPSAWPREARDASPAGAPNS